MKRSERLHLLANRLRDGSPINWAAELDAMTLEQAAQDAEYAEAVAERRLEELRSMSPSIRVPGENAD